MESNIESLETTTLQVLALRRTPWFGRDVLGVIARHLWSMRIVIPAFYVEDVNGIFIADRIPATLIVGHSYIFTVVYGKASISGYYNPFNGEFIISVGLECAKNAIPAMYCNGNICHGIGIGSQSRREEHFILSSLLSSGNVRLENTISQSFCDNLKDELLHSYYYRGKDGRYVLIAGDTVHALYMVIWIARLIIRDPSQLEYKGL